MTELFELLAWCFLIGWVAGSLVRELRNVRCRSALQRTADILGKTDRVYLPPRWRS